MESSYSKPGPKIPESENREAREKLVGVYFTQKEFENLKKITKQLGYRSNSSLIADVLSGPINDGFSGLSFMKLGKAIASLHNKAGSKPQLSALFAKVKLTPDETKDEDLKH